MPYLVESNEWRLLHGLGGLLGQKKARYQLQAGPLNDHNGVQSSQMPRHLISDAHEWINEIPTVPIYYLAKPQPGERAWQNQRGKKTLLSLTLV
ncbi:hypothetical protein N7509_000488 [Penicillium cosmopolitanum]|uniref:Uncharacterized protein n=2 Tax=Penicillium TaxID=5073 RepID=A0A9W9WAP5_9EURO|nr:hypothetical protein N7509_000488 [Penicillium cosmopolitanum]